MLNHCHFLSVRLLSSAKITRILERMHSLVDSTGEGTTLELQKANALRQSILKQAFSGRLVEQDTSDEPTVVLLERIKAEKASQAQKISSRKRKVANS